MPRARFFEESQKPPKLPDAHPFDFIDQFGKLRVGLIFEGGGDDSLDAGAAGSAGHGRGVDAITGDNRERVRRIQAARL